MWVVFFSLLILFVLNNNWNLCTFFWMWFHLSHIKATHKCWNTTTVEPQQTISWIFLQNQRRHKHSCKGVLGRQWSTSCFCFSLGSAAIGIWLQCYLYCRQVPFSSVIKCIFSKSFQFFWWLLSVLDSRLNEHWSLSCKSCDSNLSRSDLTFMYHFHSNILNCMWSHSWIGTPQTAM